VVILAGGDIGVGAATLPNEVITPAARSDLQAAATLGVLATVTVEGIGTLDQSAEGGVSVAITLSVSFTTPSATPTPTISNTSLGVVRESGGWLVPAALLLGVSLVLVGAASVLRTPPPDR
jgi:hypothetical protein